MRRSRESGRPSAQMISNGLVVAYGLVAYLLGLLSLLYLLGFLADAGVPKGINGGAPSDLWPAVATNLGLIGLFGLHHSATARRWFKRRWTRFVPPSLERATYIYMTVLATTALVVLWRPIPVTVWRVDDAFGQWAIWATYLAMWAMMLACTFQVGHLGFFGLAQAWSWVKGTPTAQTPFCARWLYAVVRHPISLGWMMLPWLTPHLTVGQLVFGLGVAAYVLTATLFEEADLVAELGDTYRRYRQQVPAFLPSLRSVAGRQHAERQR